MQKYILIFILSVLLVSTGQAQTDKTAVSEKAPDSSAVITLPFEIINGYPLVKCQMDGKEGKFLFDTGNTGDHLSLNIKYFDVAKDKLTKIGEGFYGSGEKFDVYAKQVGSLACGDLVKKNFRSTLNEMGGAEKAMGGSLLGMIGVSAMLDYEMLIDYSRKVIKLYPIDANGELLVKRDETLTPKTVINFDFVKNLPIADAVIKSKDGNKDIRVSFDTGKSLIFVKDSVKQNWVDAKFVDLGEDNKYRSLISFKGSDKVHQIDSMVFLDQSHMEAEGYKYEIGLGYPFLHKQPTLWNFKKKTITLL